MTPRSRRRVPVVSQTPTARFATLDDLANDAAQVPFAKQDEPMLIGAARRECLDWIIPLGERHLRQVTASIAHYNAESRRVRRGP